ncbi:peptidoglycan-binding domain-containing protein [Streptomyces sp. UNOC14_S4]|uniref:peptidoglycan-binding domain-containing protein n=1 Tax=Streptomyces sp. UNOC14_S4 TaxID=2872340 RepID=UPI001E63C2B5|nr:peptidoglycan-binding domain-containing protein [Streptomyces sp. UNOC14_S4]MCC3768061.1 peptidoglycan-binding protein [Streptomyces sp. UNOC14_S4]
MGITWIPGAERLGGGDIGGDMDTPDEPPRIVWHTTESGAGDAEFDSTADYLIEIGAEPHVLYDPTTDRIGQFGPLDESARALRNDGGDRTNRTGRVCVQVEVLARASEPFTDYWRPGPNFAALLDAARSWGVPDAWPAGDLAADGSDSTSRDSDTWHSEGGHYGHTNVPGNDHWDPGAIDRSAILAAGSGSGVPAAVDDEDEDESDGSSEAAEVSLAKVVAAAGNDPDAAQGATTHRDDVLVVERALQAEGLLSADWVDGSFGTSTQDAYAEWQGRCGYEGDDADGVPGRTSLEKLGAEHGFRVTD